MRKAFLVFLIVFVPLTAVAKRLTLHDAVKLALKRNPTYKAAHYVYLASKEKEKEAWSQRFFTLSFNYRYTRLNEEPHVRLKPVKIPPLFPGMQPVTIRPGNVVTSRQNVYQYKFIFFQPLFTGGQLSTSYEIAKLGVDVERLKEEEARLDLIFKVKQAYLNALKAEKIKKVAEETVKSLESHYRDAESFYRQGITPKVDLLRAEVALSKARQALVDADSVYKIALSSLLILLREDVNSSVELEDVLNYKPFGLTFDECLEKALNKRPIISAVKRQVEIYKKNIALAKSGYFPKIYLTAEYRKQGNTPDCTGDGLRDAEQWSITGIFDWKFFEWGKTIHQVKKAKYDYLKALEFEKSVIDKVTLEVREAYLKLKSARTKIEVARKEMAEAEENLRDTRERYKEQIDTSTDVIDAQTFFTEAEVRYYTALYDYLVAYARLMRTMGEEN